MESSIKLKDNNSNPSSNSNGNNGAAGAGASAGGGGSGSGVCVSSICSSDSFSIMPPPHHELVSANSIELNAAASLSDDSGVPLTTNSSISSGDSYRIGMCKFEIEMVESDGEVSQFDSLDNCSEGGMSAENFNTLKKGPLAPIDPPPEFQDSPQTTLVRSISKNIVNSLRRWTSSQSSFEHLKDDVTTSTKVAVEPPTKTAAAVAVAVAVMAPPEQTQAKICQMEVMESTHLSLKESYAINKHLYVSDSILNSHTDNIYDEPNNIISSSLGNSVDLLEDEGCSDQSSCSPLPSPPPPVSIIKIKQTLCPYYQDHTRYFKAIPTEQDSIASAKAAAAAASQQRFNFNAAGLSEIHDYDLYYGARRQPPSDNSSLSLQRRQASLYSPLGGHTSHCHYHNNNNNSTSSSQGHYNHPYNSHPHHHHHHHHYSGGTAASSHGHGQRPNSRNSLNSRLSSSHNSLNVSSANKPDDSIFITQAMSHDALFTREISDFYNVPIDSDIYAFPVDMIEQQQQQLEKEKEKEKERQVTANAVAGTGAGAGAGAPTYHKAASRRNKRNKRKQRHGGTTAAGAGTETSDGDGEKSGKHGKYRTPVGLGQGQCQGQTSESSEPLHMTLDEVKQFYHTLYSDAGKSCASSNGGGGGGSGGPNKPMMVKSSNETIWSVSTATTNATTTTARTRSSVGTSNRSTNAAGAGGGGSASDGGKYLSKQSKHNLDNDKLNNNNNNNNQQTPTQQQQQQQNLQQQQQQSSEKSPAGELQLQLQMQHHQQQHPNNKHVVHSEKKSQFTLNLKQKFCSIFRFRRNHHSRCRAAAASVAAANAAANASATNAALAVEATAVAAEGQDQESSPAAVTATPATAPGESSSDEGLKKFQSRALPPLPKKAAAAYAIEEAVEQPEQEDQQQKKQPGGQEPRALQFTSSIEKVKDYGWYWGPLSGEAAEKVLSNEPDGSFIVRDSSDDHYIFSLSFKLNNCVRHVRIEQDQGTFSFGSYAKFKSQTITEFIEKAVEHSRSGRYLFFLHRRPEHGPMRVQLTNPVSRFKHVQSLQHMCRFVILKAVIRKDLIQTLPLPRRLLDYLNYKHCYSEQVESDSSHSQISGDGTM
ncbi:GL14567 [Drosophila persimilis]|uniref:GL14567 n=1 Tax=Drosophila persimilis TaxID=7234 RepID=B4GW00_DROPE|nr:GL14567 [Drosophila persimilis]